MKGGEAGRKKKEEDRHKIRYYILIGSNCLDTETHAYNPLPFNIFLLFTLIFVLVMALFHMIV